MMGWFSRLPLRVLLTLPFVLMVALLAGAVGWLSYNAGRDAVDEFSGQLLVETVNRIAQAVDRHVAGSAAVLEAAFPKGVVAPASLDEDLTALRTRFWLATSVHRDPNNYAYFGDEQGRFFGLWRFSDSDAELRLRRSGNGPREVSRFTGINGVLQAPVPEQRIFDPRERPWYRTAKTRSAPTWTPIYIDFKTAELVATRARRVDNAAGQFAGVVATDLSLQRVNLFLKQLALSANGVALVVEANGDLIGVSRGPNLQVSTSGGNTRLNAADSSDPLVSATYKAVRAALTADGLRATNNAANMAAPKTGQQPRTDVFHTGDGTAVQVGSASLRDDAGLDWLIMVAVPRHDFIHHIEANFVRTGLLGLAVALVVGLIGLAVLAAVTRELRYFAVAAGQVGRGEPGVLLPTNRRDELGELARSFVAMQSRLMTDPLTGLSNREAVLRRIEERILQQRRRGDCRPFVVMFADFNRFKQINDRFGHDVGDAALRELGQRLCSAVRNNDMVARYAGDEFVLLLQSVETRRDADTVRQNLQDALQQPLAALQAHAPDEPGAGASFGVALFPDDGQDVQTLIKRADADMYKRKPVG